MNERETIAAGIAAWNEGGPDAFMKLLPPDIEWHAPPGFPQGELWTDRDSLAEEMHEQFASVFTSGHIEVLDMEPGPNGWLVAARQSAAHGSGLDLEWQTFMVIQFEDEVPQRIWIFFEREQAMQQAGLDG